jgi:hypothetical protein
MSLFRNRDIVSSLMEEVQEGAQNLLARCERMNTLPKCVRVET